MDSNLEGTNSSGVVCNSAPPTWISPWSGNLSTQGTCALHYNRNIGSYTWDQGTTGYLDPILEETQDKTSPESIHKFGSGRAVMRLRRLSGLTWDQIARIFEVDRRSVHFWANGKAMSQKREEKLYRVLDVIQKIDTGSASSNRSALLGRHSQGRSPLEMLRDSDFDEAMQAIGIKDVSRKRPKDIVPDEFERRKTPASPEQLLSALNDKAHKDIAPPRRVSKSRIGKR